jgi:hypothetical protein
MQHTFYFDGDQRNISWTIQNTITRSDESRIHAECFYEKVTSEQAKYIAFHVGLFWGIGKFLLKNGDTIKVKLEPSMYERLEKNKFTNDPFIEERIQFIDQIIQQRDLHVLYYLTDPSENKENNLSNS